MERSFSATRANEIINHESIYPWVRGNLEGHLDLSLLVANHDNVLLVGEHGCELFIQHQPGLYEVHTNILPEGRGKWAVDFVEETLKWVFTRTDAIEIMARCATLKTKALATAIGGKKEFTNPHGWIVDEKPVASDIYALRIQDWMLRAPGLRDRGKWFHVKLQEEFERHNTAAPRVPDDDTSYRYVGASIEMIFGGQIEKGVIMYNRWAVMADYQQISITSYSPPTIDIGNALLVMRDGDFWMPMVHESLRRSA